MEFIFELILDLILEGGLEASKSSRVPLPLRIFFFVLINLFFAAFIGLMIFFGIMALKESIAAGIFIFAVIALAVVGIICEFIKVYRKIKGTRT